MPTRAASTIYVIWTADYKGMFKTGDEQYCYPVTLQDGFRRYLLACRGLTGTTTAECRPVFTRLFQEYRLPEILRTDNGVPFATGALGRFSQLSVWWLRLGIDPELVEPGQPRQNGRRERLHRTFERVTARPSGSSSWLGRATSTRSWRMTSRASGPSSPSCAASRPGEKGVGSDYALRTG